MARKSVLQPDGTMVITVGDKPDKTRGGRGKLLRARMPDVTPSILAGRKTSTGKKPWAKVVLAECPVTLALQTGCGLKARSARTYLKNLRTVRQICGGASVQELLHNIDGMLHNVETAVARFKLSAWTHTAYYSALLAAIRHTVACATKSRPAFMAAKDKLQAAHRKAHLLASQPALQNAATSRMQDGWMSLAELCQVRDDLPKGSRERLLLSFATYVPPSRNDLARCKIYHTAPSKEDLELYKGNYVVLPTADKQQTFICYRVFKTMRSLGEVRVALPNTLVAECEASLSFEPRSWLFTHCGDLTKPCCNSAFSRWANSALERVCQRPVTCTLLRHIYSTAAQEKYDLSKVDCRDDATKALYKAKLLSISRAMMHSAATFLRYKFILDDGGQPTHVSTKVVLPTPHCTPIIPAAVV